MISVKEKKINDIPCLVVAHKEKQKKALPTVIYFHGFTSAKEHNLPLAYLLAKKGYRTVLPDSIYHGERETDITKAKKELAFWNIVLQNISDLKELKVYLDEKDLILNNRIGIAGTSMGAITTASALTQYKWIQSAAVLMGTPKTTVYAAELINNYSKTTKLPPQEELDELFEHLESIDLSKQIKTLADRPILLWHGKNDAVVPHKHSETFYDLARPYYKDENKIQLLLEDQQGHKVSRYAILETVKWFVNHL